MPKLMCHRPFGDSHLVVHGPTDPSDEEWADFMDTFTQHIANKCNLLFVLTHGAGITASQRHRMNLALKSARLTLIVCVDSLFVRTIAKTLGWAGIDIRAFKLSELMEALQCSGLDAMRVLPVLREMARETGVHNPLLESSQVSANVF